MARTAVSAALLRAPHRCRTSLLAGLRVASRGVAGSAAVAHAGAQAQAARRSRRLVVAAIGGLGLSASTAAAFVASHWLDESNLEPRPEEREEALERERRRQEEVERLSSQASWWRLAQIVFIMLPVAFFWPVWLVDPSAFWALFAARVDRCGPCFIKLAQWMATRRDLLPEEACVALSRMHKQVAACWSRGVSSDEVQASLREASVDIRSLEPRPHASGSIAEVFFGVLGDGTAVAVKCMRPGVKALLEADLAWLLRFGQWADTIAWLRMLGVRQAAEDFVEHVQMQTDFQTEASHLRRFRANFAADGVEAVRFPEPLYVTPQALVLSREQGRELASVFEAVGVREPGSSGSSGWRRFASASSQGGSGSSSASDEARADRERARQFKDEVRAALGIPEEVSRKIANESMAAYMRMIFRDNFIHGDLHPGNIMLQLSADAAAATAEEANGSTEAAEPRSWHQRLLDRLKPRAHTPSFELVILDAGLAIPLPREKVEALRSLAIAIIYADFNRAAEILYEQSPDSSRCWDPVAFKTRLADAFRNCRKNIWEEGFVQVSDACLEALHLVQHYNVGLDTTLTWTLFGMLSIEGSARQLDPEVDCAKAATRYILTVPSLIRELKARSWNTSRHMVLEMLFSKVGLDYWAIRHQLGLSWQTLAQ